MDDVKKSSLALDNREKLTITGLIEVISFDEERIFLTTTLGNLDIKGKNMKVSKLDVQNGEVLIVGTINSMNYNDKNISKNKESLLKKIFE